jgi:lysophospholipase L1-like esterase
MMRKTFGRPALSALSGLLAVVGLLAAGVASAADNWRFEFGAAKPSAGYINVQPDMAYSAARGFGFESGAVVRTVEDASGDRLHAGYLTGDKPFFFSVDLPEGNYNVTVTLGDGKAASNTTVKAELRRLMLENVATSAGRHRHPHLHRQRPHAAHSRRRRLAAGHVNLKAPRETVQEAWNWDQRLTLEINGASPAIRSIDITPAAGADAVPAGRLHRLRPAGEPYNSWGQMLPRFLKPASPSPTTANPAKPTAIRCAAPSRQDPQRMKPGDTVLMQFGHNDQKQIKDGKGGPFTTYKDEIRTHVEAIRARGGVAVIVSSMERRNFDANGKVVPSLIDYANAARQSAQELGVPFIDLNAMSKPFYEALGPELSKAAFAEPEPGRIDNTHHNNYGSYELAKAVLTGLRQSGVPAADYIADGYGNFDPRIPTRSRRSPYRRARTIATSARWARRTKRWRQRHPTGRLRGLHAYVFAYFIGNGEDGLHLAASKDGYRWDKLGGGRSYLTPQVGKSKLMRDPCIVRGPDGTYHMVWTSAGTRTTSATRRRRTSSTGPHSSKLPVMAHEPGVLNAWAPEIVYDDKRGEFLIFWASTIPGRFAATDGSSEEKYNHRMYYTTTRDFVTLCADKAVLRSRLQRDRRHVTAQTA